ncbi:MAG: hypothetical protein JWP43_1483, partial [Ramlibacter sp.]|nr:hypothetical protein [Ramlibacter sp.]
FEAAADPYPSSPAEFAALMKVEAPKVTEAVRLAGVVFE